MQNRQQQQQAQGNVSESGQRAEVGMSMSNMLEVQRQQEYLLGLGFTQDEVRKLQHQRAHLYENAEMQQRMADDSRIRFARWLYEQGEISEI